MSSLLPYEIYTDVTWKYLPVDEIRRLCEVNKTLSRICNDPETWVYLLKRDYGMDSVSDDPEREYRYNELYDRTKKYVLDSLVTMRQEIEEKNPMFARNHRYVAEALVAYLLGSDAFAKYKDDYRVFIRNIVRDNISMLSNKMSENRQKIEDFPVNYIIDSLIERQLEKEGY